MRSFCDETQYTPMHGEESDASAKEKRIAGTEGRPERKGWVGKGTSVFMSSLRTHTHASQATSLIRLLGGQFLYDTFLSFPFGRSVGRCCESRCLNLSLLLPISICTMAAMSWHKSSVPLTLWLYSRTERFVGHKCLLCLVRSAKRFGNELRAGHMHTLVLTSLESAEYLQVNDFIF